MIGIRRVELEPLEGDGGVDQPDEGCESKERGQLG